MGRLSLKKKVLRSYRRHAAKSPCRLKITCSGAPGCELVKKRKGRKSYCRVSKNVHVRRKHRKSKRSRKGGKSHKKSHKKSRKKSHKKSHKKMHKKSRKH